MTKALVLRTTDSGGRSYGGFQWPKTIDEEVVAPDWKDNPECGGGLHGWLYGAGEHSCTKFRGEDALWWVIEIEFESAVMLIGKVKFPKGIVRFFGDRKSATDYLYENEEKSRLVEVIGACRADLREKANVFVGALGHATAGFRGTAVAGDEGTATVGALGSATAGFRGTAVAGNRGTATVGAGGSATAGFRGEAVVGDEGTATVGDLGHATAGFRGTAVAGYGGTATADEDGVIAIGYIDKKAIRGRRKIGQVGGNCLKPNVKYRVNDRGEFEAVK